jgi:hypothetical protein
VTSDFCTKWNESITLGREVVMPKKRVKPEQLVTLLRQIEVAVANGTTTPHARKDAEVTEQTYYR